MLEPSLKRPREDDFEEELLAHDFKSLKYGSSWQTVPGAVPGSAADLDQTLRFRASALTPVDSSDDEDDHKTKVSMGNSTSPTTSAHGQRPPALQLSSPAKHFSGLAGGDQLSPWWTNEHRAQPSPIPHGMVNRSLNLSATPSALSTPVYFPAQQPVADQPQPDINMVEDVSFHKEEQPSIHPVRFPSPVSDDDATMASGPKTPTDDMDMAYSQQPSPAHGFRSSTPPARQYSQQTVGDPMYQAAKIAPSQRKRPALIMGYRADCEKCRCRVPGHYSHILRT